MLHPPAPRTVGQLKASGYKPSSVKDELRRNTHAIPLQLPDPPLIWEKNFAALAAEAQLHASTLPTAIAVLRDFWSQVQAIERDFKS